MRYHTSYHELTKAHEDDAGYDLRSQVDGYIWTGQRSLIPTGIRAAIPVGSVGLICPRSGLALKHGVTVLNAPGIIDAGYRGEIGVILQNFGDEPFHVEMGARIAQLVVVPFMALAHLQRVESLDEFNEIATARGDGGFGSTGT